jgi:hypothetical protein
MKFDPKKLNALSVRLHGKQIGVMNRFAGDRQIFAFEQDYIDDPQRPTLSLRSRAALAGSFRPCADRRQSPRRNTFACGYERVLEATAQVNSTCAASGQ